MHYEFWGLVNGGAFFRNLTIPPRLSFSNWNIFKVLSFLYVSLLRKKVTVNIMLAFPVGVGAKVL